MYSLLIFGRIRYRTKARLYGERVDELNATTQERDDLKKLYDGLRKRRYCFFFFVIRVLADLPPYMQYILLQVR